MSNERCDEGGAAAAHLCTYVYLFVCTGRTLSDYDVAAAKFCYLSKHSQLVSYLIGQRLGQYAFAAAHAR